MRQCGTHGVDTTRYKVTTTRKPLRVVVPHCGFATCLHYSHEFNTGCYGIMTSCQSCVESMRHCENNTIIFLIFEAFTSYHKPM